MNVFKQNIYETGDFVLRRSMVAIHKNKLTIRWAKPYIVIHNHKVKDVTCKYLSTDVGYVSYLEGYNVFIDINKPTIKAAMPYDDWFLIKRSPSCESNTEARITMEFHVK